MALPEAEDLTLWSLHVKRLTSAQALARVIEALATAKANGATQNLAFCNAHTATLAYQKPEYLQALSDMLVFNDGIGMQLGAKLLTGKGFPANLNGTDFVPLLLSNAQDPLRIFLLGAKPGVAERAAAAFKGQFPNHEFVGTHDGYFDRAECTRVIDLVRDAKPDVLLVGMGNPAQELFMYQSAAATGVPLAIGVGALFDFAAAEVKRAPLWVRNLRAEWLFRLMQEPVRLAKRYTIDLPVFFWVMLMFRLRAQP